MHPTPSARSFHYKGAKRRQFYIKRAYLNLKASLTGAAPEVRRSLARQVALVLRLGLRISVVRRQTHDWRGHQYNWEIDVSPPTGTKITQRQSLERRGLLARLNKAAKTASMQGHTIDIVIFKGSAFMLYSRHAPVNYGDELELAVRLTSTYPHAGHDIRADEFGSDSEAGDLLDEVLSHYQLPDMGLNEEHDSFASPAVRSRAGYLELHYPVGEPGFGLFTGSGDSSILRAPADQLAFVCY